MNPSRAARFARLLAVLFTLLGLPSVAASAPVKVVFDTDMAADVDDVGALALLHALADLGEARILAVGISSRNEEAGPCLDAINTWYGRPDFRSAISGRSRSATPRTRESDGVEVRARGRAGVPARPGQEQRCRRRRASLPQGPGRAARCQRGDGVGRLPHQHEEPCSTRPRTRSAR